MHMPGKRELCPFKYLKIFYKWEGRGEGIGSVNLVVGPVRPILGNHLVQIQIWFCEPTHAEIITKWTTPCYRHGFFGFHICQFICCLFHHRKLRRQCKMEYHAISTTRRCPGWIGNWMWTFNDFIKLERTDHLNENKTFGRHHITFIHCKLKLFCNFFIFLLSRVQIYVDKEMFSPGEAVRYLIKSWKFLWVRPSFILRNHQI